MSESMTTIPPLYCSPSNRSIPFDSPNGGVRSSANVLPWIRNAMRWRREMSENCAPQPTVVRNERGLSINGTRVTLYRLMDLIHAGQSPEEIREWLPLTEQQVTDALEYIEEHRTEVEAEYELV